MNAVRMTHPKHGATHAYGIEETRKLERYGWSVEAEAPPKAAPVEVVVKRKPGRPKGS